MPPPPRISTSRRSTSGVTSARESLRTGTARSIAWRRLVSSASRENTVISTGRSRRSCEMMDCRIASSPRFKPPYEPVIPTLKVSLPLAIQVFDARTIPTRILRMARAPKRVLVVDDNEDMRVTVQALLQADGFEVSVAADGEAALALHRKSPADVVINDLFMPDKDGIETIIELRKLYPMVKIVAISGWTSTQGSDYLQVAREIGAAATLQKPFDPAELSRVVRQLTA